MSPEMFRTFIFPQLKKAVDAIHTAGAKCIKHCDGNTWPILQDMIDAGVDCINPLEPVAGMKIAEVKRKFGNKVCIMGNIDCAELLCHGSVQEVDDAVKQVHQRRRNGRRPDRLFK